MNRIRPITTLFLIESLDGKISTGDNDYLDVDKDFPKIDGVREGLHQYYDLEKRTDFVSFNSGRVQEKVGANERTWNKRKHDVVSFVIVDNKFHLNEKGTEYFAKRSKIFYLITTNKNHPALKLKEKYDNIKILHYNKEIDFTDAFRRLKKEYGVDKMTIQTGGTINAKLVRLDLIDYVSMVIAPCLIGGDNTQSSIGGESLHNTQDLKKIRALKLIKLQALDNSYVYLQYEVLNNILGTK